MRTVQIENLRPHEILEEQSRRNLIYLPIGPLEWHGPAMPLGTDPIAAEAAARKAAEITGGVVMPTLYCGTEREREPKILSAIGFEDPTQYICGQDFPENSMRSFYTKEDMFSVIVREYLRLLVNQGYHLIVIVNGHGARNQKYQLDRLAVEISNETDSHVLIAMALASLDEGDHDMGHATRMETSIQMSVNPENVDLNQLPPKTEKLKNCDWGIVDGTTFDLKPNEDRTVIYDPRDATEEIGNHYLKNGTAALIEQVTDRWNHLFPDNMI